MVKTELEHVGLKCLGNKVETGLKWYESLDLVRRVSLAGWRRFYGVRFVEDHQFFNFPSILEGWPVKCGHHASITGFSRIIF